MILLVLLLFATSTVQMHLAYYSAHVVAAGRQTGENLEDLAKPQAASMEKLTSQTAWASGSDARQQHSFQLSTNKNNMGCGELTLLVHCLLHLVPQVLDRHLVGFVPFHC